jgi:gamma-F420-2:alpha-L-glutamate ligase
MAKVKRVWILFHRDVEASEPEASEILRFQATATRLGIELEVLKPEDFDLVVGTERGWDAVYDGRRLERPEFIIARTGAETSHFTLGVLRHFERQGVTMVNAPRRDRDRRRQTPHDAGVDRGGHPDPAHHTRQVPGRRRPG